MVQYNADLNKSMAKTVRNFNAKDRYNKTKTRGRGILPQKLSLSNLRDKYSDKPRAELEKQLKLYQSFGKRDALDLAFPNTNSRLSKWEKEYFEANRAKTEKFYDDEIADLAKIVGDKPHYFMRQHDRMVNLQRKRDKLNTDLSTLDEDQIKTLRSVYNYAERSEIVKRQGFHLYLSQLQRTMKNLGYSKQEINTLIDKFDALSENEFTEMVRNEDIIDAVYDLIDSPKKRGKYQLMTDEKRAIGIVTDIQNQADALVAKYKSHD